MDGEKGKPGCCVERKEGESFPVCHVSVLLDISKAFLCSFLAVCISSAATSLVSPFTVHLCVMD